MTDMSNPKSQRLDDSSRMATSNAAYLILIERMDRNIDRKNKTRAELRTKRSNMTSNRNAEATKNWRDSSDENDRS
jgi:hypothetical protein